MDRHGQATNRRPGFQALVLACGSSLFLSSCANTMQAVGELPETYWSATGNLLLAIGEDLIANVLWIVNLLAL